MSPHRTRPARNVKEHLHMLNETAKRNNAHSMYQLALCYMEGEKGLQKNVAKAIELFQKSGKLGHVDSYNELGKVYQYGRDGVESDLKNARHYYELGAIGGNSSARLNLGGLDLDGCNYKRAYKHVLICGKAGMKGVLDMKIMKGPIEEGYVTTEEYAEALRACQKQQDDTRSESRDEASRFLETGKELETYYHELRAAKGDFIHFIGCSFFGMVL